MKQIPEVDMVVGKMGRAETALDPAPTSMIETIVNLKPKDQWRMDDYRKMVFKLVHTDGGRKVYWAWYGLRRGLSRRMRYLRNYVRLRICPASHPRGFNRYRHG